MKLVLIGLPQSGKTTVFEAVSGVHEAVDTHGRGAVPMASVKVPDERMDFLRELEKPKKFVLATVDLHDVGGLFSDDPAAKMDPHALVAMREADGLIKVIRAFESDNVPHPDGSVDPARDLGEIDADLLLIDLDQVERRIEKLEKALNKPIKTKDEEKKELAALRRCKETIDGGGTVADVHLTEEESLLLRGFNFLTQKPGLVVLNTGEDNVDGGAALAAVRQVAPGAIAICASLEKEIAQLDPEDRPEFQREMGITEPAGPRLIRAAYDATDAASFFTTSHDETRSWTIRKGDTAVDAAGTIHTDFARGFIRAEVTAFDDLKTLGDFKAAKAKGKTRLEGKEYVVQDGDIIIFRFAT